MSALVPSTPDHFQHRARCIEPKERDAMNLYTKGHWARIFKHEGTDASNGGTTSRVDNVRIVAVLIKDDTGFRFHQAEVNKEVNSSAVFDVSDDAPPMALVYRPAFTDWILLDCRATDDGGLEVSSYSMFGGTYAMGGSGFRRTVRRPVAVHDRHESPINWKRVGPHR
jgi:hypothetical protein